MTTNSKKYLSTTLIKGMSILSAFTYEKQLLTLTELSVYTGIDKATCTRLTKTFVHLGYLGRDENKKFYLEPRVLRFGFAYLNGSELRSLGKNHLKALSMETGCTVNMAVLDDTDILIICRNEVKKALHETISEGVHLPAYCTAQGKVILAHIDETLALDKYKRSEVKRYTENTICTEDAFLEELKKIRQQGYSICNQEYDYSFSAVAAPIFDHTGEIAASMSLVYQPQATPEEEQQKLAGKIVAAAQNLSFLLGFNAPKNN
ncbi:IclR family transcriptional regulator [Desulfocastanea catecholica]